MKFLVGAVAYLLLGLAMVLFMFYREGELSSSLRIFSVNARRFFVEPRPLIYNIVNMLFGSFIAPIVGSILGISLVAGFIRAHRASRAASRSPHKAGLA